MTWAKLDDGFYDHPKVLATSNAAVGLHVKALSYCARHLTDGFVPAAAVVWLGGTIAETDELIRNKLWLADASGFRLHDFLDYQPSSKSVKKERKRAKMGMRRLRVTRRNSTGPVTENTGTGRDASTAALGERSDAALGRDCQGFPENNALRSPSMAAFRRSSLVERSEDTLHGRPLRSGTDTEGPPALSPLTDASSVAIEAATATSRPTPAEQARGLLALVNTTGGTHFQPVEANLRLIRARLTEYGDWTLAAMVRRQWATWKAQPDMRPFFRPATLFNAEKCAQYVGQLTDTDRAWIQRKQVEGAAA